MNTIAKLIIILIVTTPAIGLTEEPFIYPTEEYIDNKLGITESDLREIYKLVSQEKGYYVLKFERTQIGYIGVWMSKLPRSAQSTGGPVFFYVKYQNSWVKSDEMSEWSYRQ